jgi:hypothetical protein
MEGELPGSPCAVNGQEALPIIHLSREVWGSEDGGQGHHHQFNVSNGHVGLLCFLLGILHHDDEVGDAICLKVVLGYVPAERYYVNGIQPPAVGIEVSHDLQVRDLCVERFGVLSVVVPNLVKDVTEELGSATFVCLVAGVVIKAGFVGGLGANMDDGCGIIGNVLVIEGEAGKPDKLGATMVGFVLGGLCKDGHEGMDSQKLVI